MIDVTENAEPEFRILVEDLAFRHAVVEMSFDEVFVLQDVLHERANLLPALDTLILRQDTMTFAGKLIERIAHPTTSWVQAADS
jgi:hypothetical protein